MFALEGVFNSTPTTSNMHMHNNMHNMHMCMCMCMHMYMCVHVVVVERGGACVCYNSIFLLESRKAVERR